MKNALILHGTGDTHAANWFMWLSQALQKEGYVTWVPDLPYASKPNIQRYNEFIFANKAWEFNEESIIIGHSSGAVATLGILQQLPDNIVTKHAYLVSVFTDDLGWDSLKELFAIPLDFSIIKSHAKAFTLLHSEDDPYCPLWRAQKVAKELDATLIVKKDQGHFSTSSHPEYTTFPFLLDVINKDN